MKNIIGWIRKEEKRKGSEKEELNEEKNSYNIGEIHNIKLKNYYSWANSFISLVMLFS